MVITGRKVIRIVAVIVILAAVVFSIISLTRGVPISEIIIDNITIWISVIAVGIIALVYPPDKSKKDNE